MNKNKRFNCIQEYSSDLGSTSFGRGLIFSGAAALTLRIVCIFLALGEGKAGADSKVILDREIWKGTMNQTSPMSWSGPFELYLRYDSEADLPQKLDGLVIWPSLGQAKVKISGVWNKDREFQFSEGDCVDGDCAKVVTGGKYKATIDPKSQTLKGSAVGPMGLKGTFEAQRYRF